MGKLKAENLRLTTAWTFSAERKGNLGLIERLVNRRAGRHS